MQSTGTVEEEDLERVAPTAEEHEERAAPRVVGDVLLLRPPRRDRTGRDSMLLTSFADPPLRSAAVLSAADPTEAK